ncbi:MAG: sulfite exporter TauE/SafE family protein, partial [Candidatus Aminicenantes bacterium]|nr:sulfite exporter TauE/SafE family protein [Candidatus Aminicenantes bacterium]
ASIVGAVWGAGIVTKLPLKRIRLVMGFALMVTVFFMIVRHLKWIDALGTGTAIGLSGLKLVIGITVNFILGALMTAGVGLYAPCMALVYMLGMTPIAAFPIMMGSCAFLMPCASVKFIKASAYNRKAALGIAIGGIFGVLLAAYIVKSLPLDILTWLVIAVIFITALTLIRAGIRTQTDSTAGATASRSLKRRR